MLRTEARPVVLTFSRTVPLVAELEAARGSTPGQRRPSALLEAERARMLSGAGAARGAGDEEIAAQDAYAAAVSSARSSAIGAAVAETNCFVGARVTRGPHWPSDNTQDGGTDTAAGTAGTVCAFRRRNGQLAHDRRMDPSKLVKLPPAHAVVRWSNGRLFFYAVGKDNEFALAHYGSDQPDVRKAAASLVYEIEVSCVFCVPLLVPRHSPSAGLPFNVALVTLRRRLGPRHR